MNLRMMVLSAAAASATLFSMSAKAHDPAEFDRMMAPKAEAVPTTCVQLADTHNYSNDSSNADIKALKLRCDKLAAKAKTRAEAKAAAKAQAKPTVTPAASSHSHNQ